MKVKSLIAIVLIGSILLTGCAQSIGNSENISQSENTTISSKSESTVLETESVSSGNASETTEATTSVLGTESVNDDDSNTFEAEAESTYFQTTIDPSEFTGPSDKNFLQYVKDATYAEAVKNLNSTEYVVENVEVTYVSPEYIAELEYNSKVNVYFGHTEEEIQKEFNGEQVVFTMDEKGQTKVEKFVPNGKGLDPAYKKALIKAGMKQLIKTKSVRQFRKDDIKFRIIKLKYHSRLLFAFGKKREFAKNQYKLFSELFRFHRSENSLPPLKYLIPTDIVLYDLIPKTELPKTKKGIINLYRKCFSHKFLHGSRSENDIDELIEGLDSALHSGDSWYSIGLFDFAYSKRLNSYINYFILRIHNYSSSYAALEIQLDLSDDFKNEMNRFISSDYKKEGMAVHRHWVTNKKASGAKFGYGVSSGSLDEYAKNNIIYEQLEMVKTMFLKELSHYFQLMNFSKEKKLPGIYVCDTNITPDLDLGNAIYASLGIHERYGFFLSPEERLYVSITKDEIHTDSDDMLYIYNSSKITDYAMYSTPNNKALHYLTNDYMFEMYRVYILRVLGIRHLNILTKYRNKINNIKYSRFSLRKLLKVRNLLRKDFYDFLKINDEFPIDDATEELKAYLEKNEYAIKSVFLERIHPYRYWLSVPQAIWRQVVSNLNEIENDLNRKIEIASGVTEFYREGSNRRVGYIQLFLALLTFFLLLFPEYAAKISQLIKIIVELLKNIFK